MTAISLIRKKIKTLGGMKEGKSYNSREANPMACIWYLPNIIAFNMLKILFLYFTAMTTTHSIWLQYAKYPSVHISDSATACLHHKSMNCVSSVWYHSSTLHAQRTRGYFCMFE